MQKAQVLSSSLLTLMLGAITLDCGTSQNVTGFSESNPDGGASTEGGGGNGGGSRFAGNEGGSSNGNPSFTGDPQTCEQAAASKSYIGCDYWPTVVANAVWSVFDFAVVVANAGDAPADVTVTGPDNVHKTATVAPNQLTKIYLPWVAALKGPDADGMGKPQPMTESVLALKSAYHLVSSKPVTVYQFNALEYKGQGGGPSKNWDACPKPNGGCYSYSNDASLLLPSTAMTGNYRVTGQHGKSAGLLGGLVGGGVSPYFAVTGTADGTTVMVKVSSAGSILSGGSIASAASNGLATFRLDAGDVVELLAEAGDTSDLSGSLVHADKPVQVIAGVPCITEGPPSPNFLTPLTCDHLESSVFPAETLGRHYVVTVPTSPNGAVIGHEIRFYGNVDGTKLKYSPSRPDACPATLQAGEVVSCGEKTSVDFEVTGDHEFAIGSFMLSGYWQDPNPADPILGPEGDPSQSLTTAVEQYRTKYVFLAPDDYDQSFVDIVAPDAATITLDGVAITAAPAKIAGGYGVIRQRLNSGNAGAHVLASDKPIGIQVMGYGLQTSYQYPGGLDLHLIAPPPPPPIK